jgi:DNA-binding protein
MAQREKEMNAQDFVNFINEYLYQNHVNKDSLTQYERDFIEFYGKDFPFLTDREIVNNAYSNVDNCSTLDRIIHGYGGCGYAYNLKVNEQRREEFCKSVDYNDMECVLYNGPRINIRVGPKKVPSPKVSSYLSKGVKSDRVYIGTDKTTGKVTYIGKTNDVATRQIGHNNAGKNIQIRDIKLNSDNLTPHQARAVEQYLINKYGLSKDGANLQIK